MVVLVEKSEKHGWDSIEKLLSWYEWIALG